MVKVNIYHPDHPTRVMITLTTARKQIAEPGTGSKNTNTGTYCTRIIASRDHDNQFQNSQQGCEMLKEGFVSLEGGGGDWMVGGGAGEATLKFCLLISEGGIESCSCTHGDSDVIVLFCKRLVSDSVGASFELGGGSGVPRD